MKINIKDVLKNDTEKADLHSEHWLTDAWKQEEKSAPGGKRVGQKRRILIQILELKLSNLKCRIHDSEEEIPEAEELAEELTEGILPSRKPKLFLQKPRWSRSLRPPSSIRRSRICGYRCNSRRSRQNLQHSRKRRLQRRWPQPEAAKTSDAPVAEKTPEHSTADPAEPPKTEAQDGEFLRRRNRGGAALQEKEKHSFKKFGWAYGLAAAFALLLFVTFAYTSLVPREVNATINGQNYKIESKAFTIDEFLDEQHIKYCEDDYISRPVSTFIYDGISFKLKHATDFKVTADGKTKNYKTLCRTVGGALKDCKIKVGDADIVTPGLDTEIGDDLEVVIQRVTTSQETVEEDVVSIPLRRTILPWRKARARSKRKEARAEIK